MLTEAEILAEVYRRRTKDSNADLKRLVPVACFVVGLVLSSRALDLRQRGEHDVADDLQAAAR